MSTAGSSAAPSAAAEAIETCDEVTVGCRVPVMKVETDGSSAWVSAEIVGYVCMYVCMYVKVGGVCGCTLCLCTTMNSRLSRSHLVVASGTSMLVVCLGCVGVCWVVKGGVRCCRDARVCVLCMDCTVCVCVCVCVWFCDFFFSGYLHGHHQHHHTHTYIYTHTYIHRYTHTRTLSLSLSLSLSIY